MFSLKTSSCLRNVNKYTQHYLLAGPKISIFLTLPIVTRAAYSSPSKAPVGNAGNVVKFSLLQWHGNAFVTFQSFRFNA